VLTQVTSATLFFHNAPAVEDDLWDCVHTYCCALWSALPGLQQLELNWADPIRLLSHGLSLSALQQLTALELGARVSSAGGWSEYFFLEQQQVVELVQGAAALQAITVRRPLAAGSGSGSSKDQLVLGLQGALPALTRLEVWMEWRGWNLPPWQHCGLGWWWVTSPARKRLVMEREDPGTCWTGYDILYSKRHTLHSIVCTILRNGAGSLQRGPGGGSCKPPVN
jgi:hypothetical protein